MIAWKNSLKRFIKAGLRVGLNFVKDHPQFRLYVNTVVHKLGLDGVAHSVYTRLNPNFYGPLTGLNNIIPNDMRHLSPPARQIYADLKAAIEHHQKENR